MRKNKEVKLAVLRCIQKNKILYTVSFLLVVSVIIANSFAFEGNRVTDGNNNVLGLCEKIKDTNSEEMRTVEERIKNSNITIVVDPGHGGYDSGKVGCNGSLEKDINLKISKKLCKCLSEKGFNVILTRADDITLGTGKNKKSSDLKERVRIVNETSPNLMISIHQNSFTDSSVFGAQVFYQKGSVEGKEISNIIQNNFKMLVDDTNSRKIKESKGYYILDKINSVGIIVECGFLSNENEANILCEDDYQNKIVVAIAESLMEYYVKNNRQ